MDMVAQTINAQLFVTVPVSNAVVLGVLATGAPMVAGALFAADNLSERLFGVSSSDLTRVRYQVNGPIEGPTITFFNNGRAVAGCFADESGCLADGQSGPGSR